VAATWPAELTMAQAKHIVLAHCKGDGKLAAELWMAELEGTSTFTAESMRRWA